MKIGLPRGLLYHSYGPFMEAFLSELPAEIIISEETDRDILDRGTAACIDDACLPVKVYAGHVESLREKCDRIVVPRIMSCEYGESLCPKLNGLPELIGGEDLIFTDRIDMKNKDALLRSLYRPCPSAGDEAEGHPAGVSGGTRCLEGQRCGSVSDGVPAQNFSWPAYLQHPGFLCQYESDKKAESPNIGIITEGAVSRV